MKNVIKGFLVVFLGFWFMHNITAQEDIPANENLLSFFDSELFKWEYGSFSGFNLEYQNQTSTIILGINNVMADALRKYPDTERYYNSYHKKNIAGNILTWGGFAVAMGGLISPAFYSNADKGTFDRNLNISLGVALGGLVTELIGAFILPSSYENLFNGINLYNRHKIEEFGSRR